METSTKPVQNRIKAELAEQQKTNHWLAQQLGKGTIRYQDGVPTRYNHLWSNLEESLKYLMWIYGTCFVLQSRIVQCLSIAT